MSSSSSLKPAGGTYIYIAYIYFSLSFYPILIDKYMRVLLGIALGVSVALGASGTGDLPDLDFPEFDDYFDEDADLPLFHQTEEEYKKSLEESAARDFKEFDANEDGQLDAQEIWSKFGGYLNAIDLFYFFTQANKRNTGTVNYQEYLDYIILTTKQEHKKEAETASV